ncbi:MAG: LysM peptidoglycan-binding domain-containing protein [Streptosporangiaceae bacterium]
MAAASPAKPPGPRYQVVTVARNSTLPGIAARHGVPGGHQALAKLNAIKDPSLIYPGQKIRVPAS